MNTSYRPTLRLLYWLVAVAAFSSIGAVGVISASAVNAHAQDHSVITELLKEKQATQALAQLKTRLAQNPDDPHLRFLQGVAQALDGQNKTAIATFVRLTKDYPELPEPYNNLAVLYAAENQLDKARQTLEQAIRTNPSYSTAHENLGDIYAKMAGQAYSKALQVDDTNSTQLQPKLALIHDLFSVTGAGVLGASKTGLEADVVAVIAANGASGDKKQANSINQLLEPPALAPAAVVDAGAASAAATASAASTSPNSATPASSTAPANGTTMKDTAKEAVLAWARAWAAQNMDAYLGAYAPSFRPPSGASRSAWEKERRARIVGKRNITVELSNIEITINDSDVATARFRQDYKGDGFVSSNSKTLKLERVGERWLITREVAGG